MIVLFFAVSSWASAIPPLIGAVLGAVAAVGGGAFAQWFNRQLERQSVAAAFAGEIQGLIDVLIARRATQGLMEGRKFPLDDHPFLVFEANVGKIGFLPPSLASKVVGFYSQARGIARDFRTLYKGDFSPGFSETVFRKDLVDNINALEPVAKDLVAELEKEAVRPWHYYLQSTE